MISATVERKGYGVQRVAKRLPSAGNFIANQIAEEYAEFVRSRYLSGQSLASRRGLTRKSVRFFKLKNGQFGVRPGSGVPGRMNYLLRFERQRGRAFMRPSWRSFRQSKRHSQRAREILSRLIEASDV